MRPTCPGLAICLSSRWTESRNFNRGTEALPQAVPTRVRVRRVIRSFMDSRTHELFKKTAVCNGLARGMCKMTKETRPSESDAAFIERLAINAFAEGSRATQGPGVEHLVPGSTRLAIADVRQPPYDALGLVVCQGATTLYGTAVYCAADAVVTAKHTFEIADIRGAWLYISFDAKKNPVPPAKVAAMAVHPSLDLAVLIVDAAPRVALQFPGFHMTKGQPVSIAGYGAPYPDGSMQMTAGTGVVDEAPDHLLGYAITTDRGDSGAPLLTRTPQGGYAVVGIHTSGDTGLPSGSNFGIPMTSVYVAEVTKLLAAARKNLPL